MENEEKLRLLAQIENMRKRHRIERDQAYENGMKDSVTSVLCTMDNIKRSIMSLQSTGGKRRLTHQERAAREAGLLDGLLGIVSQLECDMAKRPLLLQRVLVQPGTLFDPSCMDAISRIEGGPSGVVAGELATGWFREGVLVRPAQVAVYG